MSVYQKILNFGKDPEVFPVIAIAGLVTINILITVLIRQYSIFYYPNSYPFGLGIGQISSSLIVGFVSFGLWKFGFIERTPIFSVLILAGVWSNYIEKLVFDGVVTDYISFWVSYINLADIQIWVGCVALIIQSWFLENNKTNKPSPA
jgi:lipoprotein signal peptidase